MYWVVASPIMEEKTEKKLCFHVIIHVCFSQNILLIEKTQQQFIVDRVLQ